MAIESSWRYHGIDADAAAPSFGPDAEPDVSLVVFPEPWLDPPDAVPDADAPDAVPSDPLPPALVYVESAAADPLVALARLSVSIAVPPSLYADAPLAPRLEAAPVNAAASTLPSCLVNRPSISEKAIEVCSPLLELLICTPPLPTEIIISPTVCAGSPFSIVVSTLKTSEPPAVVMVKAPPEPSPTTLPTAFPLGSPKVMDEVLPEDAIVNTPEDKWNVVPPMTAEPDGAKVVGECITKP